jgi:hypothetical protein
MNNAQQLTTEQTRTYLLALAERRAGVLEARDVVDAARPEDSPIHSHFTWDDGAAAERYRIWEARQLIRVSVQMLPTEGNDVETRVFVSLTSDRAQGGGYRVVATVLNDDEQRRRLIADAFEDWQRFEKRYKSLKELAEAFIPIKKVFQQLEHEKLSRTA